VQETLLRALANIHSFKPGTTAAWLLHPGAICSGRSIAKRRREVEDPDGPMRNVEDPPEQTGHVEFKEFRTALISFPRTNARRLILVGTSGFSYEEAAENLRLRGRHDQEPRHRREHPPRRTLEYRTRTIRPRSCHARGVTGDDVAKQAPKTQGCKFKLETRVSIQF